MNAQLSEDAEFRVAIVGMAGRFPGARNLDAYWQNLAAGRETLRRLTAEEVTAWGQDPAILDDPGQVTRYGVLDDDTHFDAGFFGYSPREAELIDPQQRVFLECSWQALEHAGYDPSSFPGQIGVYAGSRSNYYASIVRAQRARFPQIDEYQLAIGTSIDFLTTRVSYKVGLTGPSETILTTCSTSLVAIHQACQALIGGECDMALSGGVSIRIPRVSTPYREGGVVAPDGRCRTFDAQARGTSVGDGVGIVVLKRLNEAIADGDTIYAVLLGSAVNNDGAARLGFTAPSVEGQAAVIRAAHAVADVDPLSITYVEAHGTGTQVGDPIEVAALTRAFGTATDRTGFCGLGAVKTNIGHTDAAAGVAGLLKVVLAMRAGQMPPSLHYTEPNPAIDFPSTPFFVNAELRKWESDGPLRAGVSSFGMGGTNAHAVLEEPPVPPASEPALPRHLVPLSARTSSALAQATDNLISHLREHPEAAIADVAYTMQVGRRAMPHRRFVVCGDREAAIRALSGLDAGRVTVSADDVRPRPVGFMFPGQGTQRPGMAQGLYRAFGGFRRRVDELCEAAAEQIGTDLRKVLFPESGDAAAAMARLQRTEYGQPALFVVEYSLARLLMDLGVQPTSFIGHSLGEYVAACLAGVFSAEDAVRLVATRGKLVQRVPGGIMLAVALGEEALAGYLAPGVDIAAVNGVNQCVVSGPAEAMERVAANLSAGGVRTRRLVTPHAFHSALLDPILDEFAAHVAAIPRHTPTVPYVSNLTGALADPDQVLQPSYWVSQLRRTVRFGPGVETLLSEPDRVLVEVGPGRVLSSLVRRHPARTPAHQVVTTLGEPKDEASDVETLLTAVGNLWLTGVPVSWAGLHEHRRRRVPLPTYPFERQEYIIHPGPAQPAATMAPEPATTPADTGPDAEVDLASTVALVFQEILGGTEIRGGDDFFDLGGDSLSATQLVARIREVFLVRLPLTAVFDTPTVDGLAQVIGELMAEAPQSSVDSDDHHIG